MNAKEMWSALASRIGDPSNTAVPIPELLSMLNEGQSRVANLMWDLEAFSFQKQLIQPTATGVSQYQLAEDVLDIQYVGYDTNGTGLRVQATDVPEVKKGVLDSSVLAGATIFSPKYIRRDKVVEMHPQCVTGHATGLEIVYRRKPRKLGLHRIAAPPFRPVPLTSEDGAAGGGTVVVASLTHPAHFWKETEVSILSGDRQFEAQIVDSHAAGGVLTMRNSFSGTIVSGTQIVIIDHSILPEHLHYLVLAVATPLGHAAMKNFEEAKRTSEDFAREMEMLGISKTKVIGPKLTPTDEYDKQKRA